MDRFRQVAVVLAACGLAATGCTTTQQQSFKNSVTGTFASSPPVPANDFMCMWKNRLAYLPDPSKNGTPVPGLAGQAFLYDAYMKPAEVNGDLTVTVHDATIRPPGQPPMRSEVWHFTKETVKQFTSSDERYGRSLILFVPWPEGWRDVNVVYIQARYDQPGGKVLFCQPVTVTLDMNAPAGPGAPSTTNSMPSIPDPAKLVAQARAASATPPQFPAAMAGGMPLQQQQYAPPGYAMPPPGTMQPVGYVPYPTTAATQPPPGYFPPPSMPVPVLTPLAPAGSMPVPPQGGMPIFQPPPGNPAPLPATPAPPPDRIVIPRG